MSKNFPALNEFFKENSSDAAVKKHRGSHGGDALYRPLGLGIFTEIIAKLSQEYKFAEAIKITSKLPTSLSQAPYVGLMWDPSANRIVGSNSVTLREVLLYMVGSSKYKDATLLDRYRKGLGDEEAELPQKVV